MLLSEDRVSLSVSPDDSEMATPRFAFGKNWQRFAGAIAEDEIETAETSLRTMLGVDRLTGRTFVDVGSGSGLFSLAAVRLGASRVYSFDYDVDSVACTSMLKERYAPKATSWQIEQGNVLDDAYVGRLGVFDVVYAWGVLHHTGDLWGAIDHATRLVRPGGSLFMAVYNDQGVRSRLWRTVKRAYCQLPVVRPFIASGSAVYFGTGGVVADMLAGTNPFARYRRRTGRRGMRFWPDLLDWVGGFPFEVAKPSAISDYCKVRGFALRRVVTTRGVGNNEFIFDRNPMAPSVP